MPNKEYNVIKNISDWVYKKFCSDSGNMLVATSIIGTSLSSAAQAAVVFLNDKYTVAQKAFMIPQELVECLVSAVSIFVITKPLQNLGRRAVSSGKILPKNLIKYADKYKLTNLRGKKDFDFGKSIKGLIEKTEKNANKDMFIKEHKDALQSYNNTFDAMSAISATAGTALSVSIAVPTIRNSVAAYFQKQNMIVYNDLNRERYKTARLMSPGMKV